MHTPNEAFHAHLHEVISEARRAGAEEQPDKSLVRIKRADFLVAYYAGGMSIEDTIECDSLSAAQEIAEQMGAEDCRVFVAADVVLPEKRLRDYERDFAYVGEEIRKEQAQQQSDHEG